MPLPSPSDLKTLDYSYQGTPFCWVGAKASVVLAGLDWSYQGTPFAANEAAAGWPNKIDGVASANLGKVDGVALASVSKVDGVA